LLLSLLRPAVESKSQHPISSGRGGGKGGAVQDVDAAAAAAAESEAVSGGCCASMRLSLYVLVEFCVSV
jgi:hypothetical protein